VLFDADVHGLIVGVEDAEAGRSMESNPFPQIAFVPQERRELTLESFVTELNGT